MKDPQKLPMKGVDENFMMDESIGSLQYYDH